MPASVSSYGITIISSLLFTQHKSLLAVFFFAASHLLLISNRLNGSGTPLLYCFN
ncbi:hypothetical protein K461DRAFT_274061 [Myriangium duriaei CBS 260.36]|uniref:Uncharacterized protein n=1 Tax=Myriangium duriaei CBS 260.36 TaxID=1168546 RepID=A0A9P4JF29_9PEZI|nr:hypothetical protein K461DRAFT_274061 [Myriangium duriaei CBS 260.36]